LSRKFTITTSTPASSSTGICWCATATPAARYNKVVSKDSRRTLSSKKNLKYARHLGHIPC
jgi:hypothetical protein